MASSAPRLVVLFVVMMLLPPGVCRTSSAVPGHVEAWGNNLYGQSTPPPGLDDVIAVAGGSSHSLALRANGTVVAWGDNSTGQTNVPAGLSNVVAIAAREHCVALRADGSVVVWGSKRPVVTEIPTSVTNVLAIAAGGIVGRNESFTLAVRRDGTVVAWGLTSAGATNVPASARDVIQVSGGPYYAYALKRDGTILSWGGVGQAGDFPPPPGLNEVIAVRAGQFIGMAVKTDGSLVKWGEASHSNPPPGLSGVADVELGLTQALALLTNGTLVAWGGYSTGEGVADAFVPAGLSGVTAIASGDNHFLAITPRPNVVTITPATGARPGDDVKFEVLATGSDLAFQWRHNEVDLPGATNATLALRNVPLSAGGTYVVRVSNPYGAVLSPVTQLLFPAVPPPTITLQPQSIARYRGDIATFEVVASGAEPLTYQWFRNSSALTGQTHPSLTLTNVSTNDAGAFSVVITDAASVRVTSATATLTVLQPASTARITLDAVADASISPASNPQHDTLLVGTRGNGVPDRGLVRFDLSHLPKNTVVKGVQAKLTLVKAPFRPAAATLSLHRLLTAWSDDASWSNRTANAFWGAPGGRAGVDFLEAASATAESADFGPGDGLLRDVEGWLANPATNFGWLIKVADEGISHSAKHFGSIERGLAAQLVIDYALPVAPLVNVERTGQSIRFQLAPIAGFLYRVEARDDAGVGSWITLTNAAAGAGLEPLVFSFPIEGRQRFYRVAGE